MQKKIILFIVFISSLSFSQDRENEMLTKANKLYTNGEYLKAAAAFNNLYELNINKQDYLYYAAVSAVTVKEYKLALQYYLKLKNINYTGITTEYYATNKATKEIEVMPKKIRDSLVKSKLYRKPRKRKTKSKKAEITKNIALIYIKLDENKKALQAIKDAIKENQKSIELLLTEANIYYKLGEIEAFKKLLKKISKKERKNVDVLYNLGVLSAQSNNEKDAIKYYRKVIKIDSKFVNAYINLSAIILGKELEIVEEMNNLGNTSKDNMRYDELKQHRNNIFKEALPYLEKIIEIDKNQTEVIKTLYSVYQALDHSIKANKLKARFNL